MFSTQALENLKNYGINITLSGVIIVFAMLVLLVFVIYIFGLVMTKFFGQPKKDKVKKKKKNKLLVKNSADEVEDDEVLAAISAAVMMMDEEVVAAISAAVNMMYEGTGKTPFIRSIKPQLKQRRSAWATAGVMNNTRHF